jgi:hypothetical protein
MFFSPFTEKKHRRKFSAEFKAKKDVNLGWSLAAGNAAEIKYRELF